MQITTIGLDIAKNVFQVHGIDAAEKVVVRKQLRRGQVLKFFAALPPCLVGMNQRHRLVEGQRWLSAAGVQQDVPRASACGGIGRRPRGDLSRLARESSLRLWNLLA